MPKLDISVVTTATVKHQIVHSSALLNKTNYWEGRCLLSGTHSGKAYIELVGYKTKK